VQLQTQGVKIVTFVRTSAKPMKGVNESPKPTRFAPAGSGYAELAALQGTVGNRVAQRMIARSMQRKVATAAPRTASDSHAASQRTAIQRASVEEEDELQMKRSSQLSAAQRKGADSAGSGTAERPAPNGALPEDVRSGMERAFGSDFSDVRVSEGSRASEVGALAFTQGSDIHFAPGRYNPDTPAGRDLLGHELAHVVQQRAGRVKATGEVSGMPLNDDPALEQEADRMGAKAASELGRSLDR